MTTQIQHIACIMGTRPEIIKMAPVIEQLKKNPSYCITIINTAQHREMVDDLLKLFRIHPDIDLNIMRNNQSLASLTSRLFNHFENVLSDPYDLLLIQGDTTSTLVAAQVAFFNRIPIGHIEAGLRTYNMYHPFPEEMNRVFISKLASLHFAPTQQEANILLSEKIAKEKIFITGNTVIDSLLDFSKQDQVLPISLNNKRLILVTMHRRESFGTPVRNTFKALVKLVELFTDIEIVYPVHPNPNIQQASAEILQEHSRIHLIKPVTYDVFVALMNKAYFIMTDSGGIQEEAPALNKPILILRDVTERPLVVELGMAKLAGTEVNKIVALASEMLTDPVQYSLMQKNYSPYGDGYAAERIAYAVSKFLAEKKELICEWPV